MSTRGTLSEMFAATGLRSMSELIEAEEDLVKFGLLKVIVDDKAKRRNYVLLNPSTGEPLRLGGN